tara:strand:- start:131 stop:679 length:549 start_codon:yes stop_codon:yes gene_type:complete
MVKEPRPGRVKTRLGRSIGMTTAAWWFRHQTRRILRRLQDPRWELILSVSPDHEGMQSRVWPHRLARIPQGQGDLGARMKTLFDSLPPGPACIIGADIPGVTSREIWQAFRSLGSCDATFGPAPDGGYWLIGLKRNNPTPARLFSEVRWSTATALQDTIDNIPGLRIGRVATLNDLDNANDL